VARRLELGRVLLGLVAKAPRVLVAEERVSSKLIFASSATTSPAPVTTSGFISTTDASSAVKPVHGENEFLRR